MKITSHKLAIGLTVLTLSLFVCTAVVRAEEGTSTNPQGKPPLRDRVNARVEQIKENAEQNRDQRNKILENRKETIQDRQDIRKERKDDVKGIREDARKELKDEKGNKEARKETLQKMRHDVFTTRRDAIVKQLTLTISNLTDIKSRIETRIAKAKADGKDVAEAEKLLVTAGQKIAIAKTNVDALAAITPPTGSVASSTDSASSTPEIDLTKPRAVAEAAIKSIQEAREALRAVVVSIAHKMGRDIGNGQNHDGERNNGEHASSTVSASSTNQ